MNNENKEYTKEFIIKIPVEFLLNEVINFSNAQKLFIYRAINNLWIFLCIYLKKEEAF